MNRFKYGLMSSVAFAPDNGTGTSEADARKKLVEEQRKTVEVETQTTEDNEKIETETDEIETDTEEEIEAEDEKIEAKPDEEKHPDIVKLERTVARLQRRVGKQTGSNEALKKELADAKAALAAKEVEGDSKLTTEDVKKEAKRIADEDRARERFDTDCDKLANAAEKVDKDFDKKVAAMSEDIGPIPVAMVGILADLDNGGAVLSYLTNNVEEAEDLYALNPARMALRLAKISDKLEQEAKPKPEPRSKVPPVNEPIDGKSSSAGADIYNPQVAKKMTDDEWIRKRNQDILEKRRNGRVDLR